MILNFAVRLPGLNHQHSSFPPLAACKITDFLGQFRNSNLFQPLTALTHSETGQPLKGTKLSRGDPENMFTLAACRREPAAFIKTAHRCCTWAVSLLHGGHIGLGSELSC